MKKLMLVLPLVATSLAAHTASASDFFQWTETELRYDWGPNFREPGIKDSQSGNALDIAKSIVSLSHADGYAWGGNFINVDVLRSDNTDPAEHSPNGATEIYGVFRSDLSYAKLIDATLFKDSWLKDASLDFGGDLNTKDDLFGSQKTMAAAGIALWWDVPGFLKTAFLWDKEWNRNGVVRKTVTFDSVYRFEAAWEIPWQACDQSWLWAGFLNVNGPKGTDGFGNNMKVEVLFHPKILLDLGANFGQEKTVFVGLGYELWNNKFGVDAEKTAGARADAFFVEAAYRF